MLRRICLTLTIISLKWVDGFEPDLDEMFEPRRSSTGELVETFEIENSLLPELSTAPYQYTSPQPKSKVDIYEISKHPATLRSPIIQYALLIPQQQKTFAVAKAHTEAKEYNLEKTDNKKNKSHLEPRVENLKVHKNQFRSFVPGHNVEVLPLVRPDAIPNALYQNFHEYLHTQKAQVPRYNSNINQSKRTQLETSFEDHPTSGTIQNTHQNNRMVPGHKLNSHAESIDEFPQVLRPRLPRLHLNIARVYGVAHLPHKAPETKNFKENEMRPRAQVLAIVKGQPKSRYDKTLLYPVDLKKYFPAR